MIKGIVPIVLLALLASGVAGCVTNGSQLTPDAAPQTALAPLVGTQGVFHLPDGLPANLTADLPRALGGQYSLGVGATEPTLGVDKAGNVYMTGFQTGVRGRAPTIMMTADKGQSFKDVGPKIADTVQPHASTFDPYVYVDPATGRVFMDDIWPLGCGALSFSDDQGKTWTNNPASCGNPNVNDHQTVVAAKPRMVPMTSYPDVVYRCVNNVGASECAMSYTGGLTFTPQVPVFTGAENGGSDNPQPNVCGALTGHLAAAPDGTVYLPRGGCGYAEVALTQNDGLTWDVHVIDKTKPVDGHEVSIAVDEANHVYAMWSSKGLVYLASSVDGGQKWSAPIDVTAPGVTATEFNHVAAGAPGHVAIAYIGTTVEGGYEGKPTGTGGLGGDVVGEPDPVEWANATWNAYIGVITNATDPQPIIQTVTANDPKDPIARGLCGHTRCHGMNDFIDLVIDHDGRPWGAFVDVCTKECRTDATKHWDTAIGFVGTLQSGPALRGNMTTLPTILPPPAPKNS